ncbi:MAG: mechanosensitive ion channel family protein [Rhodobacter sp.]|nr:mechanosensitive ion channel family protein [Rhodobacter sp.]MBK8439708.1 mechanosensitive ion channel family protein [Rhodobacter sp.]
MPAFRALLLILALALAALAPALPLAAQETTETAVDYADWERTADRAEAELERSSITNDRLDVLRMQMADWRAALLTAQNANSARIATVREQIAALGPAPAEGETEAEEISARRKELADRLVKLQAPGIAADEAYRRADGLIREIDRLLRERQANELLQVWPAPVNPTNWPEAAVGISDTLLRFWDEIAEGWNTPKSRAEFQSNLPMILLLIAVWVGLTIYARRWIERFADRLQAGGSESRRHLLSLLASLGQVVVPVLGMWALSVAILQSRLLGPVTLQVAMALPFLGFTLFVAIWLGRRAFPTVQGDHAALPLPPERRAEGRFLASMMGLVLVAEALRDVSMTPQAYSDAVTSIATFPILVAGGLLLWRTGQVMRQVQREGDGQSYQLTLLRLVARALSIIGPLGPLVASVGYVAAGSAMIFPAIITLGLMTLLLILQRALSDIWSMISPAPDGEDREGLVPVLVGFALTVLSLPIVALIWGARLNDLTELWTGFREGFQMGETRISPTDFLLFAVVFAIGYMVTRLFQGALRSSILPRTSMDKGGQTALVSGMGYVGIFLSALIAINATGIDLSGLAIVAGALSVGIGFGLQNIVSNFVSGIILLVERPVSEGDWIEVGGVQGIVKTISVRSTRVQTFDRTMVIVPNADLVSQQVKNWTRFSLAGRLIVPVGVAFGSDTRKVEAILREIAEAQPLAVLNPPPLVVLQGFGADAMNFEIRVVLRDVNFSLSVRSEINHQIVQRFMEEGIEIPFAQSDVSLRNVDDIARLLAQLQGGGPAATSGPVLTEAEEQATLAESEAQRDAARDAADDAGKGPSGERA